MKGIKLAVMISILLIGMYMAPGTQAATHVYLIEVEGTVDYGMSEFVISSIAKAENDDVPIIIQLNTAGGMMDPMDDIVRSIENSNIPVIVYVAPRGAYAYSAGTFILMASHIAAMAPATSIGACHPVEIRGFEGEEASDKVTKAFSSHMRSLAEAHGRPVDIANRFVNESLSLSADDALGEGVIEVIAKDSQELLEKIDGRTIKVKEKEVTLYTKDAEIRRLEPSFRSKFMRTIGDPSVAYILLMIGIYGLIFEFMNPGAILPGVLGGICIILAFWALGSIEANVAGIALIILAVLFFIAETQIPSHGLLGIAGVASLIIGSLLISYRPEEPYMRFIIPVQLILAMSAVTAGFFLFAIVAVIRTQRKQPITGRDAMIGMEGSAKTDLDPEGKIWVRGELWGAESLSGNINTGEKVKVERCEGLKLWVKRV